jgi:hypothetical protein
MPARAARWHALCARTHAPAGSIARIRAHCCLLICLRIGTPQGEEEDEEGEEEDEEEAGGEAGGAEGAGGDDDDDDEEEEEDEEDDDDDEEGGELGTKFLLSGDADAVEADDDDFEGAEEPESEARFLLHCVAYACAHDPCDALVFVCVC